MSGVGSFGPESPPPAAAAAALYGRDEDMDNRGRPASESTGFQNDQAFLEVLLHNFLLL